jgi:hypothetical protein
VPVKVDTGADTSSIWASDIFVDDEGLLHFTLFDIESPYYSGKRHKTKNYDVRLIRSSNGTAQVRYRVKLSVQIAGRHVRGTFTLADRSKNTYPILIGCKLMHNKFLVDVSIAKPAQTADHETSMTLTEELKQDPKAFFEKYHMNNTRGDIER